MNSMFSSLGMVFGPLVGGVLFDIDLNYPFYFAAIVLVIGYIFAIFWRMERKQQQTFNETTTELWDEDVPRFFSSSILQKFDNS